MPGGGKQPGAGRKSGAAWASRKDANTRALARARVQDILTTSDNPLGILCELAANPGVEVALRITAATAAAPFLFPRLSAAVVAHAEPLDKTDSAAIVDRLMGRLARLVPTIEHAPAPDPVQEAVAA